MDLKNFPLESRQHPPNEGNEIKQTLEKQYTQQRILCDNDAKLLINKFKFMIMHEKFTRFMCTSHSLTVTFFGENECVSMYVLHAVYARDVNSFSVRIDNYLESVRVIRHL